MIFRFKTQAKYLEAYEYLLRAHQSFGSHNSELIIDIPSPDKYTVKTIMHICGECVDYDTLLAEELLKKNNRAV